MTAQGAESIGLSYESGISEQPLLGETIGASLRRVSSQHPSQYAVIAVEQGTRLSYEQLDHAVDCLACSLIEAGVMTGDRVAIWSPNCLEWVLVQYATARIGAILVNLNPAYRAAEVRHALGRSEACFVFHADRFKTSNYIGMIGQVMHELPALRQAVLLGGDEWHSMQRAPSREALDKLEAVEARLGFDDPINIQFTSGTTGSPKGATLTHHGILNNGHSVAQKLGYGVDDRVCVPVPLYHCFGMVIGNLACTSVGASIVLPGAAFDPLSTLQAVESEQCTSLYGVPTMFIAMLALDGVDDFDLSSLRTGVMAGSPCPVEVMSEVADRLNMREVTICYGMTETSPVSTQTSTDDSLDRRVSTVGRAHPHVEIKIVDPQSGAVVSRGEAGEICTRGYSVMRGYWAEPELTAEAIDSAGWMHSGDLATMDGDGYVQIVGRIKDMVIRGGENIYPREIEELLHEHPSVEDVHVVGVPDPLRGEEICACIQLKAQETVSEEEIRTICESSLAHYKVPRYVRFVESFPTTVTGKVQKFKLREQAVAELSSQQAKM